MANLKRYIQGKSLVHHTVALSLALAALVLFLGCLPPPRSRNERPAPVVNTEIVDVETARWRAKYEKNRMVPPAEYQVMPKPPRNNGFGEFNDELYRGLDAQPELPPLPADAAFMPPPPEAMSGFTTARASFAQSYDYGFDSVSAAAAPRTSASPPLSAFPPASLGQSGRQAMEPGRAGIRTDAHFYPVEQLVYGGDYGALDAPDQYRLMPRDVIAVTVRDHPEFSGQISVQPDGTVRVPNAPDMIRVRGLTTDEAAEAIRDALAVYVRGECQVRVQANRARGGYYFVLGDVTQPGRFPMGMEPVRLSDAVMAANWEANPSRLDDGEDMGPAFPAASPRGKYQTPRSADMARVMLITPHRSQPARTTHDLRQALLGMTGDDPLIRPGQIIVVPSLDGDKNRSLGLDVPEIGLPPPGLMPGRGFSTGSSAARLPEVTPPGRPAFNPGRGVPDVDANMIQAFEQQHNTEAVQVRQFQEECPDGPHEPGEFCAYGHDGAVAVESVDPNRPPAARTYGGGSTRSGGWSKGL